MNDRPVGRLLQHTIGTRELSIGYKNSKLKTDIVGGLNLATPRTSINGPGINGLLREAHQRQNVGMKETVVPEPVYYESNGGERQEVNKGKQNKKRNRKKKRQPKKNYRNKK